MRCTDVASILDDHRNTRLAPAERAEVDAHLAACADCAAAWHGQSELLALRVPAAPAALLERALLAAHTPQVVGPPSRARAPIVVAATLLVGAAFAAVTMMSVTSSPPSVTPSPSVVASQTDNYPPAPAPAANSLRELLEQVDGAGGEQRVGATSVELVETALSIAPIIRRPPDYPPSAIEQGLEGHVQVRFDVTAAGIVENPTVVESSDARFEESALRALSTWRYLPRIAAGKRVPSTGVHTVIRFALGRDAPPPEARLPQEIEESLRQDAAFSNGLEAALNRLATDDLRSAELQLDEMRAVFGRDRFEADLFGFYGYLYTVQGNYDRAIDAYETSVAAHARSGAPTSGPWVPLANLYFARHQYDMALKTLLRPSLPGGNRLSSPEARALMEQLSALGITEGTLP